MPATPVHLFNEVVGTTRLATTFDSGGSPINTFTAEISDIPARVQPISGSENVRYGRESTRRMWKIFVEPGQDILETDRITYDDNTTGTVISRTMDIQEIRNPQMANTILTIICEETD